uniref:Uncharacterized protein n=1 Tax=Arundo donax TaxID=35708 RepID=A0A0A9EKM1_ARUDO
MLGRVAARQRLVSLLMLSVVVYNDLSYEQSLRKKFIL